MFSRPALLKHSLKPALSYIKVEGVAHIYSCCLHNLKLFSRTDKFRHVKNSRTNTFGSVLLVRHESSKAPASAELSNDRLAGLDPIPEPPSVETTPAPTDVSSVVQVFSSFPKEEDLAAAHTSKPAYKPPDESPEIVPDIYKTAMEIWNEPDSPNADVGTSETVSPAKIENVSLSSTSSQKLSGGTSSDALSVPDTSEPSGPSYGSIFDSLPEPPAVNSNVPLSEGFGHETPFSELGLGGWSPSGIVQNCMEFFHVDLGLPWWQAVVAGTIIIRIMMFPLVVIAQRNIAKMQNNMPQVQQLQAKVTEARQRGDKLEAARYTNEMMKFMYEKKMNPLKNMIPPFFQAPIFMSVFFGLKGMANLPVESLKTGGILWFVDLTVPDQFYLLPIITSATLFCTVKVGADGASPSGTTSGNPHLMRYLMYGLPVLVLPFTISFPGLILVYWTTSNFISLLQVGILRIPKVREYCKIEKLVKHKPSAMPIQDKGFVGNMKEAWKNLKITSELQERERVDRMAFIKAGREPIKKTYKYDPTKVKPAMQAKKNS